MESTPDRIPAPPERRPSRRTTARFGTLRTITLVCSALVLALAGCSDSSTGIPGPRPITSPTAQVASSPHGMVASASPLATEVGARVLARGGTAVDAAVATAFALAVVEPTMSGLGGRGSIVIRDAAGNTHGIDGLNRVPTNFTGGAPPGYNQAAVPGVPAALARALAEHGSWSLAEVLAPAIELAEEGFPMPPGEAARLASARGDLLQHEASRRAFLRPDGTAYAAGDHFVQPEMARALRAMAEGGIDVFYHGWIADSIHADMVLNGGFITREELAAYEALDAIPAIGSYRGRQIVSNFRPASGHAVVLALHLLEEFPVPPRTDPAGWGALVGEAMRIAIADRNRSFGTAEQSAGVLTSRDWARTRAADMAPGATGAPVAALAGTGTDDLFGGDLESTTHLSVADAQGRAVAITQSIGPSAGTRLAASGVGFLYATRLGSTPGSRPSSTISPTLVLDAEGRVELALGGAGDSRIISAVIQSISRVLDHGMSLEQAVAAPRLHPLGGSELRLEGALWPQALRDALGARGFEVSTAASTWFGRVHAVSFDLERGRWTGVADPRRDGGVSGPDG